MHKTLAGLQKQLREVYAAVIDRIRDIAEGDDTAVLDEFGETLEVEREKSGASISASMHFGNPPSTRPELHDFALHGGSQYIRALSDFRCALHPYTYTSNA